MKEWIFNKPVLLILSVLFSSQVFAQDVGSHYNSPDRDEWQKPDQLLDYLGDLEGKTVMDLGSGPGYFTFKLADRGAKVIAGDVNQTYLDHIAEKRDKLNIDPAHLEVRKLKKNDPLLKKNEIDVLFSVNVFHHLPDRVEYFKKVKEGLKKGGKLFIVDFKKERTPHGPSVSHRLADDIIISELKEAGFELKVNRELLPEQIVFEATL